jgi:hypothetical protein
MAVGSLLIVSIIVALCGCSSIEQWAFASKVPFSRFRDVSLGVPVFEGRQVVVPVVLVDAEMASAASLYYIKTRVSGSEIDMTAVITLEGAGKYQFVLRGVSPGDYTVFYRDPDGTRHKVGQITIPKP